VFFTYQGIRRRILGSMPDDTNPRLSCPMIAAFICCHKYKDGNFIFRSKAGLGANFAHMMGVPDREYRASRPYYPSLRS
jgi:hypothetical protein